MSNSRWQGVTRPYTDTDVNRLKGSQPEYSAFAHRSATRLWEPLNSEDYVHAMGAEQAIKRCRWLKRECQPFIVQVGR